MDTFEFGKGFVGIATGTCDYDDKTGVAYVGFYHVSVGEVRKATPAETWAYANKAPDATLLFPTKDSLYKLIEDLKDLRTESYGND